MVVRRLAFGAFMVMGLMTSPALAGVEGAACTGPYPSLAICQDNGPSDCLVDAQNKCADHGGVSAYSCETCGYYEHPTNLNAQDQVQATLCPGQDQSNGWYMYLEYYCIE